ncbi:Transmembrane protein 53-A [Merluccius polli]|uniref:Transmembrane protein 53-A n=1 Tax=Merluccius polli TaxID=89951 RepID=A0AA47MNI3_MERPO|nr:Transmembrane protein 53-A [Merluccius polli]
MLRRGVITQSLCKNITLYLNQAGLSPASNNTRTPADLLHTRPLLLMLPWLGSRPQAVDKYCERYFSSGFDVLMVQSNVTDFLWPRWGLENAERLLGLLHSDRFVSRPLLVHAFSIGCYTFSQILVHVSQDPDKYKAFTSRIKGHVYDSAVVGSIDKMADGVGKTVFPRFERVVKQASLLYFSTFKHQTVDHFNRSIDVFRNTPICAPVLFFFCENDPLSDHLAVEEILGLWRKRGIDVTGKCWADSTHAGHIRRHPQEYRVTLDNFLHSLKLGPLKSKM